MSAISNIARVRQIEEQASQQRHIDACVNQLVDFYLQFPNVDYWHTTVKIAIEAIYSCWRTETWSSQTYKQVALHAAHQAFGDPMALTREQLKLRQHATQYYNPMSVAINVEPLGLPDEEGGIIKKVVPGGIVKIPHGYLVGGKRSTLHTTAPQLLPMPVVEHQANLIDSTPITYVEWMTYYSCATSHCCSRDIVWSDTLQTLVCLGCKQNVKWKGTPK